MDQFQAISCWSCPWADHRSQSDPLTAPPSSLFRATHMWLLWDPVTTPCRQLLASAGPTSLSQTFFSAMVLVHKRLSPPCLPPMGVNCFACSQDERFLMYFAYILNYELLHIYTKLVVSYMYEFLLTLSGFPNLLLVITISFSWFEENRDSHFFNFLLLQTF